MGALREPRGAGGSHDLDWVLSTDFTPIAIEARQLAAKIDSAFAPGRGGYNLKSLRAQFAESFDEGQSDLEVARHLLVAFFSKRHNLDLKSKSRKKYFGGIRIIFDRSPFEWKTKSNLYIDKVYLNSILRTKGAIESGLSVRIFIRSIQYGCLDMKFEFARQLEVETRDVEAIPYVKNALADGLVNHIEITPPKP